MPESVIRSISGLVYIGLLVSSILYSSTFYKILFLLFMILASYEFSKMIAISKTHALLLSTLVAGIYLLFPTINFAGWLICIPFLVYLSYKLFAQKTYAYKTMGKKLMYQIGYINLPFLCILQLPYFENQYQPKLVLGFFILIWCNDTFAYICGKLLGKYKLFPSISPKKTIEGFVGGVLFAIIAGVLINSYFIEVSYLFWVLVAILVGSFGTVGDLVESKFKRQAEIKDSGKIIPGHGGILDRLDSFIFVAPFLLLIYNLILYVS